jgi:hypothetical protein
MSKRYERKNIDQTAFAALLADRMTYEFRIDYPDPQVATLRRRLAVQNDLNSALLGHEVYLDGVSQGVESSLVLTGLDTIAGGYTEPATVAETLADHETRIDALENPP